MRLLLALILLLGLPLLSEAATYTAASCSYTDVNNAVNNHSPAVIDGDTVQIPVGTCTWTTTLAIVDKSITLQGAVVVPVSITGVAAQAIQDICNTGGQTTYTCILSQIPIINWTTKATGLNNSILGFTQLKNLVTVSSGNGAGCQGYGPASINFLGVSPNVRMTGAMVVYGNVGNQNGCWGVRFKQAYGVMDNMTFYAHNGLLHAYTAMHTGTISGPVLYGDESWARDSTQGGVGNVYIEDSSHVAEAVVVTANPGAGAFYSDHFYGGRAVTRFSKIIDGQLQNHGTDSGGRVRGFRHVEQYRNSWAWSGTNAAALTVFRGGTGKMFDNYATGLASRFVGINTYRAGPTQGDATGYPWAYCKKEAVTLTRSGTLATGVTANDHGISASKGYVDIMGAVDSNFNGTYIVADRYDATISTSSAANPTTITTTAPHGFTTGQRIYITGHLVATSLNLSGLPGYIITVTGASTFTIPVNSVGGNSGIAGNARIFTYAVANTGSTSDSGTLQGNFDGNTDATGYPCLDQAGRGKGGLLAGDGPGFTAVTPAGYPNQAAEPIYTWDNLLQGVLNPSHAVPQGADAVIEERDYFNQNNSFNGTSQHGIGVGTRTQRDISAPTPNKINDAWWSTDQGGNWNTSTTETYSALVGLTSGADGCLDVWNGSSWVNCAYTPYTYPHPLRAGSGPSGQPVSPSGFHFVGTTTSTTASLAWTANTETDLAGYRLYCSPVTAGNGTMVKEITLAGALAAHSSSTTGFYKTEQAKICYFTVTAFNTTGLESAPSSEVNIAFTGLSRTAAPSRSPRP